MKRLHRHSAEAFSNMSRMQQSVECIATPEVVAGYHDVHVQRAPVRIALDGERLADHDGLPV